MSSDGRQDSEGVRQSNLLTAIERIGFLEWRLEQVGAELTSTRMALVEQRLELARASRREAESAEQLRELRTQVAKSQDESARLERRFLESEATRAQLEKTIRPVAFEEIAADYARLLARSRTADVEAAALSEAHAQIARLQGQLDRFFERLIQWQHASASGDPDAIDLMELISELRGETLRLEAAHAAERKNAGALARALALAETDNQKLRGEGTKPRQDSSPKESDSSIDEAISESGFTPLVEQEGCHELAEAVVHDESPWLRNAPIRRADAILALQSLQTVDEARAVFDSVIGKAPVAALAEIVELQSLAGTAAATVLAVVTFEAQTFEARLAAAQVLGNLGGKIANLVLNYCAEGPDWRLRAAGTEGLLGMPGASTEMVQSALRRGLSDTEPQVRRRTALAAAGSPVCTEDVLMAYLHDNDVATRRALAAAIGERGEIKGLLALSRLLHDPDDQVQKVTARALERRLKIPLLSKFEPTERGRRAAARAVRKQLIEQSTTLCSK